MTWIDAELALIALAAMLSPTTLSFSIFALVVGDRPLRTGFWFYTGALTATLAIGIAAAFVLGDAAASSTSTPKTWVAVVDVIAAVLILVWVARVWRRPVDPAKTQAMVDRMSGLATAPILAILGAGAALANPGGFIPLALKDISETNPTTAGYAIQWLFFTLVSLLPLAVALLLLLVAPTWTGRMLARVRDWLVRRAPTIAYVILVVLAASLLRNGIAGLTS
ncbi:MAG TPA: GAP family protein [Gaiellaceae bacterium]|nr:GAP family protein [Gaiellaceae bacterium]